MKFRIAGKALWFFWEVGIIILNYFLTAARTPRDRQRLARAEWLSRSSRRHLRIFGYQVSVSGPIPKSGLLMCNHLSYLDILALSAVTPAVFVSKADVRKWPLFGWFAALSGTVFVDRQRRTHVGQVNQEIETALAAGALVVVFPEGTSSDGTEILPFRTSLLEPAARGNHEISVAWIHYEIPGGDARQTVCYWGDHSFLPHVLNLLGQKSIHATIRFAKFPRATDDRKVLATQLRDAVVKLKEPQPPAAAPSTSSPAPSASC